jgi:hypothetical protein
MQFMMALPLQRLLNYALKAKRSEWKNAKHADQWENTIATFVTPKIGKMRVDQINTGHIAKLLEEEIKKKSGEVEGPFWNVRIETATRVRQRIEVNGTARITSLTVMCSSGPSTLRGAFCHRRP